MQKLFVKHFSIKQCAYTDPCVSVASRSPSFNTLIQTKRRQVILGVLEEQRRQKLHGNYSDERIRAVSTETSSWAGSRALQIGNDDAKEVGCPPTLVFDRGLFVEDDSFPMDVDDVSVYMPSLCASSYGSTSSTSEGTDGMSWADKLMGEDLIPDML
jgi:hypothetical protein